MAENNKKITLFSKVYEAFLNKITEDTYLYYTREEVNDDAESMLISAINRFEYPKVNIRDYDINFSDMDHESRGCFNVELGFDEIEILSTLMVIEWSKRKLADASLLGLIYTGSDAKSLGTKSQIEAIKSQLSFFQNEAKVQKYKYSLRKINEDKSVEVDNINLSGGNFLLVTNKRNQNGRIR